jgi:hypothetical protein
MSLSQIDSSAINLGLSSGTGNLVLSVSPTFTGQVGVNTSVPYGNLSVKGQFTSVTTTDFTALSLGTALGIGLGASSGATYGKITVGTAGDTIVGNLALMQYGGNVGVGTSLPTVVLDVADNNNNQNGQLRLSSSNTYGTRMTFNSTSTNGRIWQVGSNFAIGNGEYAILDATAATTRFQIDANGNFGFGVTPSTVSGTYGTLELINGSFIGAQGPYLYYGSNTYYNQAWKYKLASSGATLYTSAGGSHQWQTATGGTAGSTISWTTGVYLSSSGYLGVGTTSPTYGISLTGASGSSASGMRISDGTNELTTGFWDGTNARIESSSKPMLFTSYSNSISFGINGNGSALVINTSSQVTKPSQPYIYFRPGNTGSSGDFNTVYGVVSQGGMAYSTSNGSVTVPTAGVYVILWQTIGNDTSGRQDTHIYYNGGSSISSGLSEDSSAGYHMRTHALAYKMNANDYIQLYHSDWYYYGQGDPGEWVAFSMYLLG